MDPLLPFVSWIEPLLKQPFPDKFAPGTVEHEILAALRDGWGTLPTAELLTGLTARYGDRAREVVGRFIEVCVHRDWAATGEREAHPGSEIDDFVRLLWGPLPGIGFEFTKEGDGTDLRFRVTRCPVYEAAVATGMKDWMFVLSCATDPFSATGFSPLIDFDRTETLMEGGTHCNHHYRLRGGSLD